MVHMVATLNTSLLMSTYAGLKTFSSAHFPVTSTSLSSADSTAEPSQIPSPLRSIDTPGPQTPAVDMDPVTKPQVDWDSFLSLIEPADVPELNDWSLSNDFDTPLQSGPEPSPIDPFSMLLDPAPPSSPTDLPCLPALPTSPSSSVEKRRASIDPDEEHEPVWKRARHDAQPV